jgi:hypothetical protein
MIQIEARRPRVRNIFDVSDPYAWLIRTALLLAILPGFGLGVVLVVVYGFRVSWPAPWPALAQVHGQVQALGFTALFVIGVGLQLFPRFLGVPLRQAERAVWGGTLVAGGLLARWFAQPAPISELRTAALIVSAALVPLGLIACASTFHGLNRGSVVTAERTQESWRAFLIPGGFSLGAALLLYAWTTLGLAAGELLVPQTLDEALVHLELAGFAVCFPLAVGSRVFERFLLLRTNPRLAFYNSRLAATYAAGLTAVVVGWLMGDEGGVLRLGGAVLELGVLGWWLWAIGLYKAPSRLSGTPLVTGPTRRWVRWAFGFLTLALSVQLILFARDLFGSPVLGTELSAVRHALAQGFLIPLIVAMAVRLLPVVSADALKRPGRLEITLSLCFAGAALRSGPELLGAYEYPVGLPVALGGTLSTTAFLYFAWILWASLGRLPKSQTG